MYEDRPESERSLHTFVSIKMLPDRLERLSNLVGDILKLGSVPSIVLGLLLVWSFTTRALIPFSLDVSSAFALSVIALACLGFLLLFGSIPLIPIILIQLNQVVLDGNEGRTLRGLCRFLRNYGVISIPYLVWAFSWPIMLWLGVLVHPTYASNPPVFWSAFVLCFHVFA